MQTILKGKISRVVPAHELDQHTEEGWEIVESFDQDDLIDVPVSEDATVPKRDPLRGQGTVYPPHLVGGSSPSHYVAPGFKPKVVSRRYYLVVYDRGKKVADLHERADEATRERNKLQGELGRVQREHKEWTHAIEAQMESLQSELHKTQEKHRRDELLLIEHRKRRNKMEGDMGKVKQAIGDLKFTEIVGKDEDNEETD